MTETDMKLTNLATPNWTGLIENDAMKQVAVDTLREYGVGTCGPSGFYGTIGALSFLLHQRGLFAFPSPPLVLYEQSSTTELPSSSRPLATISQPITQSPSNHTYHSSLVCSGILSLHLEYSSPSAR